MMQGDFNGAQQPLEQALVIDPRMAARLHFELGQMYHHAGQQIMARQQLKLSQDLYGLHSSPDY